MHFPVNLDKLIVKCLLSIGILPSWGRCLGLDDLPQELTDIAEAILDQDIVTFTDFLEY